MTPAQLTALKAAIAANTTPIPTGQPWTGSFGGMAINAIPIGNADGAAAIAGWYNLPATPNYLAWQSAVDLAVIRGAVQLANYTPSDAIPGSPSTDLTYSNRAFLCQLKQANAIFLTQGSGTVNAASVNLRQSFQDCMRQIPSGNGGAVQDAGWGPPATPGAVRLAMQRPVTNLEKIFSIAGSGPGNTGTDPRGSTTNPDALVVEGSIAYQDVLLAWNS